MDIFDYLENEIIEIESLFCLFEKVRYVCFLFCFCFLLKHRISCIGCRIGNP